MTIKYSFLGFGRKQCQESHKTTNWLPADASLTLQYFQWHRIIPYQATIAAALNLKFRDECYADCRNIPPL